MKNKMKNRTKKGLQRTVAGALAVALLLPCATTAFAAPAVENTAAEKEEVIYAMADASGSVNSVYAVNIFGAGDVTDYGNYTSVKMLNTTDAISQNGDTVAFHTDTERTYYQGELASTNLPWNISLVYLLDGKVVQPEEVAGQSGHIVIHFAISESPNYSGPDFYNNYALQASLTLDASKCTGITAEGATLANVGGNKQLSYTVLPGKGLTTTIEADVVEFEMEGVSINAVPLSLNIDVDTSELTDKTAELQDGVGDLDDGAHDLADGANDLNDGAAKLADGAADLKDGATELADGTTTLSNGAKDLAEGAGNLNSGAITLADGAAQVNDGAKALQSAITGDLTSGAAALNSGAGTLADGLNTLNGKSADLVSGAYQAFAGLCTAAQAQLNPQLTENGFDAVALTPETYAAVLQNLIDNLGGEAYKQIEAAVRVQVTAAVRAQVEQSVAENAGSVYLQYVLGQMDDAAKAAVYQAAAAQTVAEQYRQTVNPDATDEEVAAYLASEQGQAALQVALEGMTEEQKQAALNTAAAQAVAALTEDQKTAILQGAVEQTMQTEAILSKIESEVSDQMANNPDVQEKLAAASSTLKALTALKAQLDSFNTFYTGLQSYTAAVGSATTGAASVKTGSQQLYDAIAGDLTSGANTLVGGTSTLASGAASLKEGAATLATGSNTLLDGAGSLADGAATLKDGTVTLQDGTTTLTDGTTKLVDGTAELTDGTGELRDKTGDIDTQIQDKIDEKIDELTGSGEVPGSFVSAKNTNVKSVQFVIKTAAIELPEADTAAETETASLNFWQKLLALFGL